MSVQVSYKKQFVLGLILILVILGAVETSIRVYLILNPTCFVLNSPLYPENYFLKNQICSDSNKLVIGNYDKILKPIPNQDFPTISINQFGFRGENIEQNKLDDVFRIFFLGGSTAFGWGASSDETTIPSFLESKLNDLITDKQIQVINAGCPGCSSIEEVVLIKNKIIDFEPDLLIIYDGTNDVDNYFLPETLLITAENKDDIKNHSIGFASDFQTYNFLQFIFSTRSEVKEIQNPISIPEFSTAWKDRWIEICELGNKNGFSTMITIQPMIFSGNKQLSSFESNIQYSWENEPKVLSNLAKNLENMNKTCTKTLDLRNSLDNTTETIFFDKSHMGDTGNEIISNNLVPAIVSIINTE